MNASYEDLFDSSIAFKHNELAQDALREIPTCQGVLLFVDSQNKPIQLIQTGNLRRLSRARIIPDNASLRKTDVSSLTHKIYWLSCYNHFMTQLCYIQLAHTLFDKAADSWIQLSTPSFAVIDLDSPLPYFYVSNDPDITEKREVYGLFPNRKASQKFTEILNTVFCLCRNPVLLKTQRQSGCPYLQMNKCPGPCLNSGQKKSYLNRIHQSLSAAGKCIIPTMDEFTSLMHEAAKAMNFEKANELKKKIDLLSQLQKNDYRWTGNLNNLCILHVDKGFKQAVEGTKQKVLHYKWLKINSNAVYNLGDFLSESHEDISRFLEEKWTTAPVISYASDTKEHLANLTYFMFRSKPAGFWLDCSNGIEAQKLYSGLDQFLQSFSSNSTEKRTLSNAQRPE
jgi:excinuclease UvrABC nuclease subunit